MKYLLIISVSLCGCKSLPNDYNPHLVLTQGPCRVWRFQDLGEPRYFTECTNVVVVKDPKPAFDFKGSQ